MAVRRKGDVSLARGEDTDLVLFEDLNEHRRNGWAPYDRQASANFNGDTGSANGRLVLR